MAVKITWLPANKTIEVDLDSMPYKEHGKPHSFLDVAKNCGIHLEHACGGNCACTTCHVVLKKGEEMLGEMDDDEADRLDMAADLTLHSRLGCQAAMFNLFLRRPISTAHLERSLSNFTNCWSIASILLRQSSSSLMQVNSRCLL